MRSFAGPTRRTFLKAAAGFTAAAPALGIQPRPKLLVLLIAEQFRTDYLDSHAGVFGSGGFRRLMEKGSFFPDCRIESTTFTASGLATIATGAYPSVHGIVADRWYDRGAHQAADEDLAATVFAPGRCRAIAFDSPMSGLLGTPNEPADLAEFAPDPARKWAWQALGSKSSVPMRVISFDAAKPEEFAELWKASPLGQAAQFALARDTIQREKLGRGEGLDCLSIVLSSLGKLGYEAGANSPLVFDLVSQLDRQIESFLDFLDSAVGENGYQIVFSACHGAPDTPARPVPGEEIVHAVGANVEAYLYPFLYLKGNVRREDRIAAAQAARRSGKVNAWLTADGDCSHTGDFRRRMENSFYRGRSGDVMFAYPPGAVEYYDAGHGVSYGSIYNYDARVPLMLHGPQFLARTFEQSIELTDLAPTLARAMGTVPPSSSTGRVLGEAFR
ncbi:MAG: type phosphodiesterase/nucleotide pyrophosphatase [Bryobacterales bacterium]|nr:type phosphodiesterase/nucleotide pyrophosphatase [Bryobacterales bacterium]